MKRSIILGTFLVLSAIHSTRADFAMNLPNTGEGGNNVADTNYVLSYARTINDTPEPMTAYGIEYPVSLWVSAPSGSDWIKPEIDFQGHWFYELSLNIPGITSISGRWATDNDSEIFLNGISTGFSKSEWGFMSLADFNITSGFTGTDTLLFRV